MNLLKPFVIKDTSIHTMGNQLYKYLDIKMHHHIINKDFKKIIVVGVYDRDVDISHHEKKDKLFNWQRPTAEIDGHNLTIKCPPGKEYVMHYGSLIASYLALNNRKFDQVYYLVPNEKECKQLILNSNLKDIKANKIVFIGYGLETISGKKRWHGKGPFLYTHSKISGKKVTFIGCKHSLWGDIAGHVVKFMAKELGVKNIIYIGKLGSLDKNFTPNIFLATGDTSYINGKIIKWNNLFTFIKNPLVKRGKHYTSPSPLLETKEWLKKNKKFHFVDPEIGYMAEAAKESNIQFSYLHIISNNLGKKLKENLSNERSRTIIEKRKNLLLTIKSILENVVRRL